MTSSSSSLCSRYKLFRNSNFLMKSPDFIIAANSISCPEVTGVLCSFLRKCLSSIQIWVTIACLSAILSSFVCLWEIAVTSALSSAFRRVLSLKTTTACSRNAFLTASVCHRIKEYVAKGWDLMKVRLFAPSSRHLLCRWHLTCVCKTALKSSRPLSQVWSCSLVMLPLVSTVFPVALALSVRMSTHSAKSEWWLSVTWKNHFASWIGFHTP